MFCTKCGTSNADGAKFCAECGNPIVKRKASNNQQNSTKKNNQNINDNSSVNEPDTLEKISKTVDNISNKFTNSFNKNKIISVNENDFRFENSGLKVFTLSSNIDTSNVQRTEYNNYFSQLGGFLAFIVYGGLVGIALSCLGVIINIIFYKNWGNLFFTYGGTSFTINFQLILNCIIQLVFLALVSILLFRCLMKIKHKDIDFLHFYHKICIVNLIALAAFMLLPTLIAICFNMNYYFNPHYISSLWTLLSTRIVSIVVSIAFYCLGILLMTLYFIKSVRVRTYMGTDMYIKISYFTRNSIAPQPANFQNDGNNNQSTAAAQINTQNNTSCNNPQNNFNNTSNPTINNNTQTIFCKNCGNKITDDNIFCTKCGTRAR